MQVLFLRIFKNSISCPKNGTVVDKDIRVRYQVVKDQPCVKPMLKHKKIHIPCLWKCVLIDKTHSKATEYLRIIDSDLLLSKSYQIRQLSLETPVFIAFAEPFTYSSSIVAGGFPVRSYMTLLTPLTSFTMRLVTLLKSSHGSSADSAVMKSVVVTARRTTA